MNYINSWIQLNSSDDEFQLSDQVRNKDAFHGTDVGWVSQMRPFIREFTNPGDLVLDPFAGIGTTLVSAQLEERASIGIELERSRVKLINDRWGECGFEMDDLKVIQGDCVSEISKLVQLESEPFIDFCITSVPYYGSQWQGSGAKEQLYSKVCYVDYLSHMKMLFFYLKMAMKKNSYLVFIAENIRNADGTLLPITWDLGNSLAKYFNVYDERIITYLKSSDDSENPCIHTNRAHEYAIVARSVSTNVSLSNGVDFLINLNRRGFEFIVYGSFSSLLKNEVNFAQDIDLIISNEKESKINILTYLITDGFDIFDNGRLVNSIFSESKTNNLNEVRYFRCLSAGTVKKLDVVFLDSDEYNKIDTIKINSPRECISRK